MNDTEKLNLLWASVKVMRELQKDFAVSQDHNTMKNLVRAEADVDALLKLYEKDSSTLHKKNYEQ